MPFRGEVSMRLWPVFACIFLLPAWGWSQANPPLKRVERQKPCMGTTLRLVAHGWPENAVVDAMEQAFARAEALNRKLSDYLSDSELMRLCARAGQPDPVPVSPELFEVLQAAQAMSVKTDGAFDVTVGQLTREWRLARKSFRLPDEGILAKGREVVGYRKIELTETNSVRLRTPGMRLDLGGIAKGYTADEVLKVLKQAGFPRALVALGGDLVAGDAPPDKPAWDVELIDLPGDKGGKRRIPLVNHAVSTSGDLEQFLEINGVRYGHILDPRTGLGTTDRAAATVIAPKGMDADSLTKACCLLPAEKALEVVSAYRAQARLVRPGADATRPAHITVSPGFPTLAKAKD